MSHDQENARVVGIEKGDRYSIGRYYIGKVHIVSFHFSLFHVGIFFGKRERERPDQSRAGPPHCHTSGGRLAIISY